MTPVSRARVVSLVSVVCCGLFGTSWCFPILLCFLRFLVWRGHDSALESAMRRAHERFSVTFNDYFLRAVVCRELLIIFVNGATRPGSPRKVDLADGRDSCPALRQ